MSGRVANPPHTIVFLGPSIELEVARRTLPHAEYRPPIRRGDLDDIPTGAVVGIIDGVFAERLAISPGEVREALDRGVAVYGASSMGALRAAEIPRVVGVGHIYEMYRSGAIERDDEVALLFDPATLKPVTEPLINVRYAVDRLVRSGTLNRETGNLLVESCARLHYTERTYPEILRSSPLVDKKDAQEIIHLLRNFNLKRDDAQFLLETLAQLRSTPSSREAITASEGGEQSVTVRVHAVESADAPVLIWESGDQVEFTDLIQFMKLTGTFEQHVRNTIARFTLAGRPLRRLSDSSVESQRLDPAEAAQELLDAKRLEWGWESPEEAHVTMRDLGLGLANISPSLEAAALADQQIREFGRSKSRVLAKALRSELWMNDLALKREVMRFGALRHFARAGAKAGAASAEELDDARRTTSRIRRSMQWSVTRHDLIALGLAESEIEQMVHELALARRGARSLVAAMDRSTMGRGDATAQQLSARADQWREAGLSFKPSPKAHDSSRFSASLPEAHAMAEAIAKQMGVVRIGLIGELDTLGIHVAQAFGERSGWSSSFSSGKAETREGARVGSIMEEVEIHAQDAYQPTVELNFASGNAPSVARFVHPDELDLPFDSRFNPELRIAWSRCVNLIDAQPVLVPTSCLVGERLANDIHYSPRLGGKIFSSSGLGSGFSLAEAAVHGAAEVIERHALRLAELEIDNPGGVGQRQFWFVDLDTLPESCARIVGKYRKAGMRVRVLDITSEIAIPTFYARVFDDPFDTNGSMSSDGFACHPDPEVAIAMALLEAAQTKAGVIAGGREDYSLQARSLGRHERPRTMVPSSQVFWFCNDRPVRDFRAIAGFKARDIVSELEWMVDRVAEGGYGRFLIADLSTTRIRPAHAVRVLIPGTETTNPLYTGPRARATLVRDLLPRSLERW